MIKVSISTIEHKDISSIIEYSNNAKVHPDSQIDAIANSIAEYSFLDPIAVDENNIILEGHGRLAAAKKIGIKQVPVIRVTGLSESQKKSYRIAHNKLNMKTGFDAEAIAAELAVLQEMEYDLKLTGFNDSELDELLERESGDFTCGGADEDSERDVDEVEPRCKLGEIWQLGRHKILVGDSTDAELVQRLLGDRKVDMIWSDAPYGMNLNTSYSNSLTNFDRNIKKSRGYQPVIGDDKEFDPRPFFELFQSTKEQFWWGADYYRAFLPSGGSWLVWNKREGLPEFNYTSAEFELCWSKTSHARKIVGIRWFGAFGMEKEGGEKRVHPTQKPVALAEWCFEKYGNPSDTIFDPFLGSGISFLAAERMEGDRTVYGVELSEHYVEICIQRYEKMTHDTAHLIDSVQTAIA